MLFGTCHDCNMTLAFAGSRPALRLATPPTPAAGTGGLTAAADPAGIELWNSDVKLLNLIEGEDVLI